MREVALAALVVLVATPGGARADEAEARRFFDLGREALDARRFVEARDHLRRSLELHAHPSTAFNLALALEGLGELVDAEQLCDQVLAGAFGAVDEERRHHADATCAQVRRDLPQIEIEASGAARIQIRLDGDVVGEVDDGGRVARPADPGRHVVTARAPGYVSDERAIDLDRGERTTLALRVTSASRNVEAPSKDAWWWIAGGAGLLAVAAVVTLLVVLPSSQEPAEGDFPITMTLRGP